MNYKIEIECKECHKINAVKIPANEFIKWLKGENIQDALKSLNNNERELLLSHICGECFDKICEQ